MKKNRNLSVAIGVSMLMVATGSALLFSSKNCAAAELVEFKIHAVDSISGKAVSGVWIGIRAQQPSGEWPLKVWDYTNPEGFVELQASGEEFLIRTEKRGYEEFSYGGCSGGFLAKVVRLEDIRLAKSQKIIQLEGGREVSIIQVVKYVETKVYVTPEKGDPSIKEAERVVKR